MSIVLVFGMFTVTVTIQPIPGNGPPTARRAVYRKAIHVSTRTPHRTGLQGRPHTLGDSTSHTTRHYSGIPHTQIFPTKHTPALLGKRWHPAHPRMYRCRPAAAAPLTLPISDPSDVGYPRSTRDAGTHTPEPSAVARAACAPSPAHTSSATSTYPLPHTEPLARRLS